MSYSAIRRRRTLTLTAVTVSGAAVLTAIPAAGYELKQAPPPGSVASKAETALTRYVDSCAKDSVDITPSPDNAVFTVTYNDMDVMLESTDRARAVEKTCDVIITLTAPRGYSYAITSIDQRGVSEIYPFATGTLTTAYTDPQDGSVDPLVKTFTSPKSHNFTQTYNIDKKRQVWSPCGGKHVTQVLSRLDIKRDPRSHSGGGYLALDSTDVSTGTNLDVAWKRC